MPQRVPQAEIDRIKTEISLQRLVEASGIELRKHGGDLRGLCPFHDDHEPSLVITPKKNVWHCLGACNKGGSVIDWVMQTRGVSFRHAVELLRAEHPSLSMRLDHVVRKGTTEAVKLEAPFEISADDKQVLNQVVDYYHRTLKQSPEALRYLGSRGLNHPEMIDHFKLGFANRTLGYRLPDKNRKAGAEMRGRLERLGIFRTETGHEHFNGLDRDSSLRSHRRRRRDVRTQSDAGAHEGIGVPLISSGAASRRMERRGACGHRKRSSSAKRSSMR